MMISAFLQNQHKCSECADQTAEEPMARRVGTYQGTTDQQGAGRAVIIKTLTMKERAYVMTEATVVQAEEPKKENSSAIAEGTPSASTKHMLIIYDDKAGRIPDPLENNLQLMYRYLGNQVRRHYFRYRTIEEPKPYAGDNQFLKEQYQKEKGEYEEEVKKYKNARASMRWYLQQDQLLLILIVTNSVMEYLLEDMQQDAEFSNLLAHPNHRIAYVLMRPTAGFPNYCEPLCTYEGVALEVACQHITTAIETVTREYFFGDLTLPQENPLTLLTSPTSIHVSVPSKSDQTTQVLAGLQAVLEQTHTRVVESQQLAIAERSSLQESEAELRREVEGMKQQITTLQTWQNASLATKLRRLFSH